MVTILAVVVGAAASYVASSRAERRAFERSLATRWDDRTLTAYVDYISSVKAVFRRARQVLRERDAGHDCGPILSKLEEDEHNRSLLFESILLLANQETIGIAHRLNREIWRIIDLARDPACGASSLDEAALFAVLSEFGRGARADLHVDRTGRSVLGRDWSEKT